jgi:hypothetical protein
MGKKLIEEYTCEECGDVRQVPENHNCFHTTHPLTGWFTLGRYQVSGNPDTGGGLHEKYVCSKDCMHTYIDKQPDGVNDMPDESSTVCDWCEQDSGVIMASNPISGKQYCSDKCVIAYKKSEGL